MCFASFSVRLTVSAVLVELVDQNNISADFHQLRLFWSVFLAHVFKQDQEPVKRQSLVAESTVLIVSLIIYFFL